MTREEAIDKELDKLQGEFLKVNLPLMEKMTLFAKVQNAVRYVADLPHVEPKGDLISREEALMAITGVNLPNDKYKLIALYDKSIKALPTVEAVPLSVIGDIKAEIERESDYKPYEMYDMKWAFNKALGIIDKAVKEYTHEV